MQIIFVLLMIFQNIIFLPVLPVNPPQNSLFETRQIENNPDELLYIDKTLDFTVRYPSDLHPYANNISDLQISFLDADGEPHISIYREITDFSSVQEWLQQNTEAYDALSQRGDTRFPKENRPEIVKEEIQDGLEFITTYTNYDGVDEDENFTYYKGYSTFFRKDGYVYHIDGGMKYDKNTDMEALLADQMKFVHSFHFN